MHYASREHLFYHDACIWHTTLPPSVTPFICLVIFSTNSAIIVAVGVSCARGGSNTLLHRVEYLEGGEQETVDLSKEQHEWEDGRG